MPLLDTLVPSASADVVAIYDDNFNQIFSGARPIKVTVTEIAKVMEHPIETGATITDHRVIQPVEIEMSMIITGAEYRSVYQQIRQIYQNATLLTVQTRTASYTDMLLNGIPHEEDPDYFDAIAIILKLKEVLFVTAQFGTLPPSKVANKSQASTVQQGNKQTKEVNRSLANQTFGKSGI